MADAGARERGAAGAEELGAVCRAISDLRIAVVLLTALWLSGGGGEPVVAGGALVVCAVVAFLPVVLWERIGSTVMRHPAYLAADLLISVTALALVGPESPFLLFALGVALLAGVLYGIPGAAIFSLLLLAGHATVAGLHPESADPLTRLDATFWLPLLYPLCAAGGAAVRRLLDHQAADRAALARVQRLEATAAERARVAREMHDSLGKTLHGLALQSRAVAATARRQPGRAEQVADTLAANAQEAAREAREIIRDLRSDDLALPAHEAVRAIAQDWAQEAGHHLEIDVEPVEVGCDPRSELLAILTESLRNVERHARASRVEVTLRSREDGALLLVRDDGCGLATAPDDPALARGGHFGLVGMRERAHLVGGSLSASTARGGGTLVELTVPREPSVATPARSAPAGGVDLTPPTPLLATPREVS